MKVLLSILIVVGLLFVGWKTWVYWEEVQKEGKKEETKPEILDSRYLQGMPYKLETELSDSKKEGAEGLKRFLDRWSPSIQDPRLGALELDYVVAISATDPIEAKRLFSKVKERIPPDSPLYPRIKALQNTYE